MSPPAGHPPGRRVVLGAGIGNALEWYDWTVYAVFAPFFASQFFHRADPTSAVISTLAVFAVGFLMRPLGGLCFGRLADRAGRQPALVWSMGCTAAGSLIIAVAPTHSVLGGGAAAVLLLGRLAQGFGLGGEIGVSYTFLAESAPPARRGLWSSSYYVGVTCGTVLGTVEGVVLNSVLGPAGVAAWGWRIPFAVGAGLGIYAWFLRRRLPETNAFRQARRSEPGADPAGGARIPRAAVLRLVGLVTGGTVAFYTWSVAAPGYAISVKHLDPRSALLAGVLANLVFAAALPLWGLCSDRWGRKPNVIAFVVGTAAVTIALDDVGDGVGGLALVMSAALVFQAAMSSIVPALFAELFPTRVRATGISVPYSVTVAIFGGTAPMLQTWLASHGRPAVFSAYTVVLLGGTLVTILLTPETRHRPLTPAAGDRRREGEQRLALAYPSSA
jgi:MFS transporter, MHS family, alpha-ketoglutarate permease